MRFLLKVDMFYAMLGENGFIFPAGACNNHIMPGVGLAASKVYHNVHDAITDL